MKAIKTILLFATAFLLFSCKSALPSDEILRGYGWTLEFESLTDPQQSLVLTKEDFAFQRSGRGHYLYSNPNAEVEFIWSATKGGFAVSPSVVNRKEGYFIKSLTGPFVPVERRIED